MKLNIFNNKSLALLLWKKSDSNEDQVSMYCGTLKIKDQHLVFNRWNEHPEIIVQNEWIHRIKKVPQNLEKDLGNCDYQLSLSVENLSKDEGGDLYTKTGLKWID